VSFRLTLAGGGPPPVPLNASREESAPDCADEDMRPVREALIN